MKVRELVAKLTADGIDQDAKIGIGTEHLEYVESMDDIHILICPGCLLVIIEQDKRRECIPCKSDTEFSHGSWE